MRTIAEKHQITDVTDLVDQSAAINPQSFVPRKDPYAKSAFQTSASPIAPMLPSMAVTRMVIPSAAVDFSSNAPSIDRIANLKNCSRTIRIARMILISGATKRVIRHVV